MSKDEVKQLTAEQHRALIETGNIFCWRKCLTGLAKKFINFIFDIILSSEFLVWVAFTIAFFFALFYFKLGKNQWIWMIYMIISIVFIVARSLRVVLEQKTTLEIKMAAEAKATAALTGDVSNIAKTAIDAAKGV